MFKLSLAVISRIMKMVPLFEQTLITHIQRLFVAMSKNSVE